MDPAEDLLITASTDSNENYYYTSNSIRPMSSSSSWSFLNIMGNNNNTRKSPEKKQGTKKSVAKKPSAERTTKPLSSERTTILQTTSSSDRSAITSPSALNNLEFEVNRLHHDVEQARLMRRAIDKRKQQNQEKEKKNLERKEPTEQEVRLGLNGLEEAVKLRRMGRTREALEISELSIELLIAYLKSDPKIYNYSSVNRDAIGIRIQNALNLAETMKSELKSSSSDERTIAAIHKKHSLALESTVNSISKMLDSAKKKSKTKTIKNRTSEQRPKVPIRKNEKNETMRKNTESRQARNITSSVPSPFVNSEDPLVKVIKSDLYIDPSKLHSVTWNDIAGLKDAKQALQEAAILPLMRPDLFSGLRRPRNILLYGPPGTGKTMLVKAVAHESSCLLFVCTASAMTSKWHGEGEKLLKKLFEIARAAAPSIIFVDEMDALLSSRKSDGEHEASRRFKTEFMTNMDGIVKSGGDETEKNLLVIAATNCPWDIDSAVLRRFPRRIYVPLPDPMTREALLRSLLDKAGDTKMSKKDIQLCVNRLDGFSGSDIASIASEASFGPIRSLGSMDVIQAASSSDIRPIQRRDFDEAIDNATKSVSKAVLQQYDRWRQDQAAS